MTGPVQPQIIKRPSRRRHQKARTGCGICKRRHIKCDEAKPECQNCLTFKVRCEYSDVHLSKGIDQLSIIVSSGPGPQRGRGRPRLTWPERTPRRAEPSLPIKNPANEHTLSLKTVKAYNLLLEHLQWPGHTDAMISYMEIKEKRPSPILNFSDACIADLVRSLVASHLAHIQPQNQHHFRIIAESFCSAGLRGLASQLASVDPNSSHTVFVAAVLVCITTLAQGPRAGEYLLFSDVAVAEWFPLLQGLKSVLTTFSISAIFSGPLRLFSCHTARTGRTTADILHLPRLEWIDPFNQLKDFVAKSSGIEMESNVEAVLSLGQCYEAIWGGTDLAYQGDAVNGLAFMWTYRLKDDFIRRLQRKDPITLVIFAHFAVLLTSLEYIWFIKGWPEHILAGIAGNIDHMYLAWLQWPLEVVGRCTE